LRDSDSRELRRATSWKIIVDVNTHDAVGDVFVESGANVIWANSHYPDETPDEFIEDFARNEGRIIVSHDRQFLKMIQQRRFQFDIPASSGFGRILLCGYEPRQAERVREVMPLLELMRGWAIASDHRFIVTVGDNWIRFDDKPIARVIRGEPATS
jgi:hypothetical protein